MDYNKIPEEQLQLIEDVVLNRRKGAADELIELAAEIKPRLMLPRLQLRQAVLLPRNRLLLNGERRVLKNV